MSPKNYLRQISVVIVIEILIIITAIYLSSSFWSRVCSNSVVSCLTDKNLSIVDFFLLSMWRPFILTPLPVFSLMSGNLFGASLGTFVAAVGATLSCLPMYFLAKLVGNKMVSPWLNSNLPQTLKFLKSQDWKIILACRLIPVLPFDLLTFIFGLMNFRGKYVLVMTFLGILPECLVFAKIATPSSTTLGSTIVTLVVICSCCLLPGLIIEYRSRKRGSSLWTQTKAMWQELKAEIKLNNEIVKRHQHDPQKTPILLLYGFFSSRRSLTALEKRLYKHGYEVISFNLGGLFGVFFTRSITDTARYIDYKLKRQFKRNKFNKIKIVAHSKGGLVALWWLLKLGGSKYCDRVITMGTPFKGSVLTWLALVTPLGFIFKDVWQMRPGSVFLKNLQSFKIPDNLTIYNIYSKNDRVATDQNAVFTSIQNSSQIVPIPMHSISHFEFLYRKDVGDSLVNLLGSPYVEGPLTQNPSDKSP